MNDGLKANFSSQRSAIPFGKFESGSDDEFPCNESMVGREGARAKLIDFLTNAGTRKAILVTGRRGMGKTSFVEYCIAEYKAARVERYWRSDVGRTIRALVWLIVIGMLATTAFMLGSRILQILLFNAVKPKSEFLWIPTAFLCLGLCYPLFYAGNILSTIIQRVTNFKRYTIIGFLSVLVFSVAFIYILPESELPLATLSRLVVAIAAVYFIGELIDSFLILCLIPIGLFFAFKDIFIKSLVEQVKVAGLTGEMPSYVFLILLVCFTFYIVLSENKLLISLFKKDKRSNFGPFLQFILGVVAFCFTFMIEPIFNVNKAGYTQLVIGNLSVASILLGLGAINHSVSLIKYFQDVKKLQINSIFIKTIALFCLLGLMFCLPYLASYLVKYLISWELITNKISFNELSSWNLLIKIFLSVICIRLAHSALITKNCRQKDQSMFTKIVYDNKKYIYPSSMLAMKAIFFIVLSLYAIHPTFYLIDNLKENKIKDCVAHYSGEVENEDKQPNFLAKDHRYCTVPAYQSTAKLSAARELNVSGITKNPNPEPKYFTLFPQPQAEITYIGMVIAIIVLLFWIEYEWIIRPGQFTRRDNALYLGNRPSYYNDFNHIKQKIKPKDTDEDQKRKAQRNAVQDYILGQANNRKSMRDFQSLTFLGYFNHFHMSTLVSTINLGFEELEHRSVIYSMLLSIRGLYYEKFVSLRSPRVMIRSVFGLFVAMILVTHLANNSLFNIDLDELKKAIEKQRFNSLNSAWSDNNIIQTNEKNTATLFVVTNDNKVIISKDEKTDPTTKYCKKHKKLDGGTQQIIETFDLLPKVPMLLCELNGFYATQILPIMYFELVPILVPKNGPPLNGILSFPFDIRLPYYKYDYNYYSLVCDPNKKGITCPLDLKQPDRLSFCVYHFFLFTIVFYFFRRLNRVLGLVPYPIILENIDDLIQGLTSNTKTRKNRDYPLYARWASAFSGKFHENERSVEREKLDPREVELQFMSILEKVCYSRSSYFKPLHSTNDSPSVEVTFVFDELDKLATDISSQQQKGNPDGNDSELHRLNLMKGLLSNMKRIITSSEARYIFLGGRLLHDDWLADGARRQPLLTSIFSNEIYLPSLLTDPNIDWFDVEKQDDNTPQMSGNDLTQGNYPLDERIEEYFFWQFYMARMRFINWIPRIWMPMIGLGERNLNPRSFIQSSYKKLKNEFKDSMNAGFLDHDIPLKTIPIRYTNYGDHLNPENGSGRELSRLKAFIDFLSYRSLGNPKFLNELMASFMISVDRAVPNAEVRKKYFSCQDVLFLPDNKVMRIQLIARVYQQLCKGFEEKIRGRDDKAIIALIYMSDFLFKFHNRAFSWENLELIDELVHIHRGHDLRTLLHELVEHYSDRYLHRIVNGMYTYRFRSYFAKELDYLSRHSEEEMAAFNFTLDEAQALRDHLEKLLEHGGKSDKTDTLSMLGELHEFYQEYERARYYYRRCIALRHETFKEYVGNTVGKGDNEMALLQALNTNSPTGREALLALQNWAPSTLRLYLKIIISYEKEHNENDALNRCKLCIKFAETMMYAFTQVAINKEKCTPAYLYTYHKRTTPIHFHVLEYLGLLFEPLFAYAWLLEKNSHTSANSFQVLDDGIKNFNTVLDADNCQAQYGYVQSQWYKKLGDLCFYKGYATKAGKLYVEEAQKYYAKSARILSNYLSYNIETDSNGNVDVDSFQKTLLQQHYPADFCLSVAECIGDLSESILAQIPPDKLFDGKFTRNLNIEKPYEDMAKNLVQDIDQWFFHSSKDENTCILDWLAKCEHIDNERFASLSVQKQFDLALDLSLASSFYLLRAGQVEGAAREAIQTIEIIAQYCNWFWFRTITQRRPKNYLKYYPVLQEAVKKVIWFSKYLYWLLIEVRPKVDNKKSNSYLMGDLIPSSALTAVCSIGLSLSMFRVRQNYLSPMIRKRVGNCVYDIAGIIKKWTGSERPELDPAFKPNKYRYFPDLYDYFENKLIYSLQRHRYPVLNQLNALKILVDASLMRWSLFKDEDAIKNTHDWLEELYQINKKYNHPLHFTPMQIGLSCYLYAHMQKNKPDNKLIEFRSFDLHAETRQRLVQSLDMVHMGRGYYQAIEKLYYLYDDFNDNQIHRYHALQMAGMELTRTSLGNIWELDVRYEKF